mmetsp:Transcript_2998/g.6933  ORF Transcript_2998/g.6933 Transcript_2998/m.6933 type:complete len:101 (+) Transcript_2998:2244-2546(+)
MADDVANRPLAPAKRVETYKGAKGAAQEDAVHCASSPPLPQLEFATISQRGSVAAEPLLCVSDETGPRRKSAAADLHFRIFSKRPEHPPGDCVHPESQGA